MDIFKLVGSVFIDNEEANKSLSKTDDKAKAVGDTLVSGAKKAGKFAVGLGAAAAGVVTSMVGMANETASSMDVIDKASIRMGISAESYQELAHAAGLSGVEIGTLEKAAKKLEGTGLNMDEALEEIYALTTEEERAAKASELFGDAVAYSLTPMLQASGEEFAAMRQEANDLGLVMSEDTVKAGASLNDAFSNIKDSVSALGNSLMGSLLPIIQEGAEMVLGFMPTIQAIVGQIGPVLGNLLSSLMPILMQVVQSVLPPLLKLLEALMPLFQMLCELILPIVVKLIQWIAEFIANVVIPVITKVVEVIKNALSNAKEMFTSFKETVVGVFKAIVEGVKKPINSIIGFINTMIEALNGLHFDIPDWVPVLGGKSFGFNLKTIPLLADGGNINGSGAAIVGEAGAELINMPKGASVTPLQRGETALNADKILAVLQSMHEEQKQFMTDYESILTDALNNMGIMWNDRELGRMVREYV